MPSSQPPDEAVRPPSPSGRSSMDEVEIKTRQHAAAAGAPQGRHGVDGRDLVELLAGRVARICAEAADEGGRLEEMRIALADAMEQPWVEASEKRFAALLATDCDAIAGAHSAALGDAIRSAFEWTGWVHDTTLPGTSHGSGTQALPRLRGTGAPSTTKRVALETAYGMCLGRHFRTAEAIHAAYAEWLAGKGGYWARRWEEVSQLAVVEVFGEHPPPKLQVSMRFSYSSW